MQQLSMFVVMTAKQMMRVKKESLVEAGVSLSLKKF